MDSSAHDRGSRPSRGRRREAGLAEPRNGKSPPPPVRIRWYHTRALNKDGGSDRLNSWTPVVALRQARGKRQAVVNELPPG